MKLENILANMRNSGVLVLWSEITEICASVKDVVEDVCQQACSITETCG